MVGGGVQAAGTARGRLARGRPNWWVVLAVSLALIAVLVATAGTTPPSVRGSALGAHAAARARVPANAATHSSETNGRARAATTTTSTTAPATTPGGGPSSPPSLLSFPAPSSGRTVTGGGVVTTTTAPTPTTTTTAPQGAVQQSATRSTQNEGYLDPPLQTSQVFAFTGAGATEVSVVWSGNTYLTMVVTCSNVSQSVGGTSAMQATLPDAEGSCRATVSEPSSESTTLTFTITIGPPGG